MKKVRPCFPPDRAVLVEGVGQVEIPFSTKNRRWYMSHDDGVVFLSERESFTSFAIIHVPHHTGVIVESNIEMLE